MTLYSSTTQKGAAGFSDAWHKRRTKADWAGIGPEDAFKNNTDYYLRLSAQRLLDRMMKSAQHKAARAAGAKSAEELKPGVKPQIAPCYTAYPAAPGAFAAIGLTAYLEFEGRVRHRPLATHLKSYMENPPPEHRGGTGAEAYARTVAAVARWVHARLVMEELARNARVGAVEHYRLFSASQETLRFRSLDEIYRAAILYGDVLPDPNLLNIHATARALLEAILAESEKYFRLLPKAPSRSLTTLGCHWTKAVARCAAPFFPPPPPKPGEKGSDLPLRIQERLRNRERMRKMQRRMEEDLDLPLLIPDPPDTGDMEDENARLAPLEAPAPPLMDEPRDAAEHVKNALSAAMEQKEGGPGRQGDKTPEARKTLQEFHSAVEQAGGQESKWEDMRSDLVEGHLRRAPFSTGPVEGSLSEGHEVNVRMGDGKTAGGSIFDQSVALSDDLRAWEKLLEEAGPITDALKRNLYPNVVSKPQIRRLRTSGGLDPARLPLAGFLSTVFRRYRVRERDDPRGRPVLCIAADGSGSLNPRQMRMLKVLSAAYLASTMGTGIQVLAGLYHSGRVRKGVAGPLVQWIYHPRKTPAASPLDGVRALVTLPDTGTGVQSDALSLAFILDEAKAVARGDMVYLVLISDTAWNRSFARNMTGAEEVRSLFDSAYGESEGMLHTTLVALGAENKTGFEDRLDKVILVPDEHLADHAAVAEKIALYVASCIRERTRRLKR